MDTHPSPLRVATSVVILVIDWLAFAGALVHAESWRIGIVLGAIATSLVVAILERMRGATTARAVLRASFAGAVVAAPLPVLGTLVAVACLVWSAVVPARTHDAYGEPHSR